MIEKIKEKLVQARKEKETHVKNLEQLTSARGKCVAVINGVEGKISILEELVKMETK